jgi:hypothetical protein
MQNAVYRSAAFFCIIELRKTQVAAFQRNAVLTMTVKWNGRTETWTLTSQMKSFQIAGGVTMRSLPIRWVYFFVAVTIGIVAYSLSQSSESHTPKDYVLPHDDFDKTTLEQIQAALEQYHVAETPHDHEVYMITGGLGVANPRIMAWDADGNMTFGLNGPPGTIFTFREMAQNPMTWKKVTPDEKLTQKPTPQNKQDMTFSYEPLRWIKHTTKDGQVYYKLADASQSPQYFFKKGNTFIWVMPFPQDVFPEGVMTHLVPVGNPTGK